MKRLLIGMLVTSAFALPTLAIAQTSPSDTATATAVGGGGGQGGSAAGGTATGGTSTATSGGMGGAGGNGGLATGGSATTTVTVNLPSTSGVGASTNSGTSGTGTSGTGVNGTAAAGDPGSSPNNTKATVDYGGTYTVKSAPSIVAPTLTTTLSDTCMGSVSFGLSFTGFGATGGSTMVDQACVRRLDAREFRSMGMNDVALALLCQSEANRKAVESTGKFCPGMEKPAMVGTGVGAAPTPSAEVGQNTDAQYKDPIVRSRLGLEALPDQSASK
ncbi:hypothetical protein [Glaciimonas soli]|uniref:CheA signal transduction histidine kinase n=1 Tax=Glaciimonas soli TaxID=2590999 RepID=A0A843YS71_9BURK|nr:hypothetical protein [Glaciimonas soli]MQQ99545.1 hypothetical protein [Glaciimonas soli]